LADSEKLADGAQIIDSVQEDDCVNASVRVKLPELENDSETDIESETEKLSLFVNSDDSLKLDEYVTSVVIVNTSLSVKLIVSLKLELSDNDKLIEKP
jgi:hypothetical protein